MNNVPLQLKKILQTPNYSYEKFHENTSISVSKDKKIVVKKVYFKAYDRFNAIKLGKCAIPPSFKTIITHRASQRDINLKNHMSSTKIGSLLYYSAGMKGYKNPFESYRFYPSAGGRFPLETYLISNRVEGLKNRGVYHYNVKGDYLEERLSTKKDTLKNCFQQPFVQKSEAILIISGVFKRTTIKYGERGYRYVLMESGHLGQNVYLIGTSLGLKICGICGFFDSKLNRYLHIDGVTESALYCFTLNS